MFLFFKDLAWMFGLVTSCASLIILIVNGCDLVIWLTTLSDACCALVFHLAIRCLTCNIAFFAHDLALTIFRCLVKWS